MVSSIPYNIRFCVDPLNKGAVFFVDCQRLLNRLQVVNPCQVHIKQHAHVVFRELPELQELRGVYHKRLAEKDQVYWQLQLVHGLLLPKNGGDNNNFLTHI